MTPSHELLHALHRLETLYDENRLSDEAIDRILAGLTPEDRRIFEERYLLPTKEE